MGVWSKDRTKGIGLVVWGQKFCTTCLAWALDKYNLVETIGFTYGQRHVVELDCRRTVLSEIIKLSKNGVADWDRIL